MCLTDFVWETSKIQIFHGFLTVPYAVKNFFLTQANVMTDARHADGILYAEAVAEETALRNPDARKTDTVRRILNFSVTPSAEWKK